MQHSLQTSPQGEHQEPKLTFMQRFQKKLAESRFFMLSLVIHVVVVILAGGIVLYKVIGDPPDFVAEGGDGLIAPTDDLTPPPESLPDAVPTEQVTPTTPTLTTPNIDVISTTAQTNSFRVAPTTVQVKINTNPADLAKATGSVMKGISGGLGNLPGPMRGRVGNGRKEAMRDKGAKPKSEIAVMKGLRWLQANQNPDGSWGDGHTGGMTGFGLLCFLGHGETPESQEFGLTVNKAVEWILQNGTKFEGRLHMANAFTQPGVYEHGICTYALGEYYTMTQDGRVKELLKQAIGYIVQGQGPNGGWMYSYDKTADDLSVSGWQIQALKAAHLSKLDIPGVDQALDKAIAYIDHDKGPNGGYGYRGPEDKYSLTGVGILCHIFWKGDRGVLRKGMDWLLEETEKKFPVKYKSEHADLYAWYYHTQACLMFGGSAWTKWNRWFQDEICDAQNSDGSWPAPGGKGHEMIGETMKEKVYRTSLCILMLEVFYRYMPTTQG